MLVLAFNMVIRTIAGLLKKYGVVQNKNIVPVYGFLMSISAYSRVLEAFYYW